MNPGKLRHRVSLLKKTTGADPDGYPTEETDDYTGHDEATLTVADATTDAGMSFRCKIMYGSGHAFTNVITIPSA